MFFGVFEIELNNKKIVYAAEMDGVIKKKILKTPLDVSILKNLDFVELKVYSSNHVSNGDEWKKYQRFWKKHLKWYSQFSQY